MFQAFILIPVLDNDGNPLRRQDYDEFEVELAEFPGGFTLRGQVTGGWVDTERLYREPMFEYELGLDSLRKVAGLVQIAEAACGRFRQLAIFIKVAGIPEIIESPRVRPASQH